jgi:hypothetical protein
MHEGSNYLNISNVRQCMPAVLLALIGVGVALNGYNFKIGSLTAMGPGFMPLVMGIGLVLLALLLFWTACNTAEETVTALPMRPLLFVGAGMLSWFLLIDTLGFFPASLAQLLLCSCAMHQQFWFKQTLLMLVVAITGYSLFVVFLGVPVSPFGS